MPTNEPSAERARTLAQHLLRDYETTSGDDFLSESRLSAWFFTALRATEQPAPEGGERTGICNGGYYREFGKPCACGAIGNGECRATFHAPRSSPAAASQPALPVSYDDEVTAEHAARIRDALAPEFATGKWDQDEYEQNCGEAREHRRRVLELCHAPVTPTPGPQPEQRGDAGGGEDYEQAWAAAVHRALRLEMDNTDLRSRLSAAEQERDRAVAAETERCAKIAESPRFANVRSITVTVGPNWTPETGAAELCNSHARMIAATIRALPETEAR